MGEERREEEGEGEEGGEVAGDGEGEEPVDGSGGSRQPARYFQDGTHLPAALRDELSNSTGV